MFRIVIASADEFLTRRLSIRLGRTQGLDVVGTARDASATLELASQVRPDVVILDHDFEGRGLIEPLKRLVPRVLIVAVTDHPDHPASGLVDRDIVALLVPEEQGCGGLRVIPASP